jgi:NADPH-dependent 2,4-dienoyl-CoA reductase/sulfur reductase-like enzyme
MARASGTRVLIIGAVAAGSKAAATARRRDPTAHITVIGDEPDIAYSACGLPYHLGDPDAIARERLVARTPERFRSDGIDLRVRHQVDRLDLEAGEARVIDLEGGRSSRAPFDRLLIATGAQAIRPAFPASADAPPTITLRSMTDLERVAPVVASARRIVVVGSGYVGLEAAESFRRRGAEVTIVEKLPRILPAFGDEAASLVAAELAANGVTLLVGRGVGALESGGVVLDDDRGLPADAVLVAVGVRPNVALAAEAGVALGTTGAVAVDDRMETDHPGVFAAGDCAETVQRQTGRPVWIPLGDTANRMGRVAGENRVGGDRRFPGVIGTTVFGCFSLNVARTGLTLADAEAAGFAPVSCRVSAPSRARYMPGSRPLELGLVVDRRDGRVLGGVAVGADGADKAIDTIATAIWGGLRIDDLADIDLAYAPPVSPVFAPVQVAAEVARGTIRSVNDGAPVVLPG